MDYCQALLKFNPDIQDALHAAHKDDVRSISILPREDGTFVTVREPTCFSEDVTETSLFMDNQKMVIYFDRG